ncbi:MAG: hypothetical protein BMS9Abin07_1935 [Acidimicrobiia bacterium]|nr:MAG: hypothetical protein BMS9Abin07_1935 [Acidimicrobiia bacterium]
MPGTPSERATLLVTVGSATLAFMLGFNLGAFGVIFFDQLLLVWVIATIVLVASIVSDLPPRTWPRRLILLLPSLWVLSAWVENAQDIANGDRVVFFLTLAVTVVSLPFVAWILVTAINTDFAELPTGNKLMVIAAVGFALVVGFGIGARNDTILTCDDFKISGNDLPANCVEVPAEL